MPRNYTLPWVAALVTIALLNIFDILPDWTTITAALTLPVLMAAGSRAKCCFGSERSA